ncbi:uncharacterized protein BDR25DRAFT_357083 [Lindgomyces ingoldianus]|uniref:Uncharacterized protein n=1 Tax=Lindgomyces ingoldianus TaxID=673940 RepID=A0ACB6QR04_9PLEO|nr:uncharacterized protein BDR25DRAFT_357083 [Lindgomyces ingoldianus]KAF2468717.1 hypothetical protein BDR25DRAFT_357083 [Lindgomyces ingoldianus]
MTVTQSSRIWIQDVYLGAQVFSNLNRNSSTLTRFMSSFIFTLGLLISSVHSVTARGCTTDGLLRYAAEYVESLQTGKLHADFASTTYWENNKTVSTTGPPLKWGGLKIDHNRTIVDQEQCATYTEIISTSPSPGYVIGTQIRMLIHPEDGYTPTLVDSIVTSKGDWQFNASKSLSLVTGENWDTLPTEKRVDRITLEKAADAYLDLWTNKSAAVPWGYPCARMEGSAYTAKGKPDDSCSVGIPAGGQPANTDRRYVTDVTVGSVSVLCKFGSMKSGAPDSHEFRLESGKLRYVHTMTVMTAK